MFGLFRFCLSIMVVAYHLGGRQVADSLGEIGAYAVFGFYVLSGYLMTLVLNERYHFNAGRYFANRALRLYPDYWVVALISLVVVLKVPEAAQFHPSFVVRTRLVDVLGNVLLFPFLFYDRSFRLIPPTWSIALEMAHYFLLWLFVARRRSFAATALALALIYHFVSLCAGQRWGERYFTVAGSALPFALGAMIYFNRDRIRSLSRFKINALGASGFLLFVASDLICLRTGAVNGRYFDLFFDISTASMVMMVSSLSCISVSWLKPFDAVMGNIAYPVFLSHWMVGTLVGKFLLHKVVQGVPLLLASLPLEVLVAALIAFGTRRLIEPIRARVRGDPRPIARDGARS